MSAALRGPRARERRRKALRRCAAALLVPVAAGAAPARQPPPEEPPGRIIYHEESGGLKTPVAPPKGPGSQPRPAVPPGAPAPAAAPPPPAPSTPAGPAGARAPASAPPASAPIAPVSPLDAPAAVAPVSPPTAPAAVAPVSPPSAPAAVAPASAPPPVAKPQARPPAQATKPSAPRAVPASRPPAKPATAPATETASRPLPLPESKPEPPAPVVSEAERARARYAELLERHWARAGTPSERARALADEGGAEIVRWRDAGTATALGWLFLEGRDAANAALWFDRARGWTPEPREATRGRALAALAENDFERALALSGELADPEARDLRRDARLGLAARHARSERHADAYRELRAAAGDGDLPRYARAQQAWSALALGERREAGEIFAGLYRDAPDAESAQGLLAAAPARPIDPVLASVEPLAGMLRKRDAERSAGEGRFLQARALDPGTYGTWGAVTAPRAAIGSAWRDKSGEEGASRLRQRASAAAEVAIPLEGAMSVRARMERQTLDAGNAATRVDLDTGVVGWRLERDFALDASVGRGPSGGALPARTIGALELAVNPAWGQAGVAGYSVPVRESILAHAGVRDPMSGEARGGVMRRALEARGLWLEKAPWSIGGRAFTAWLEGTGVESNRHRGAELAAGYDLGLAGFTYAAASLTAGTERYDTNLSGFGPGQGGYFSPQRFHRLGAALDFMTAEGGRWMLRGRVSTGWQDKREDATESTGRDASLQLAGSVRLTPHVHAGFAITRAVSPQYRETQGLIQLTVLLEPRLRVVSADIPGFGR
jgi:hypothetical protein